jgi:hypothetical protein
MTRMTDEARFELTSSFASQRSLRAEIYSFPVRYSPRYYYYVFGFRVSCHEIRGGREENGLFVVAPRSKSMSGVVHEKSDLLTVV